MVVNTVTKKHGHKWHHLLGASTMKVTTLYGIKQPHLEKFCHCGLVCVDPQHDQTQLLSLQEGAQMYGLSSDDVRHLAAGHAGTCHAPHRSLIMRFGYHTTLLSLSVITDGW